MRKVEQQMVVAVRRALESGKVGFSWKSGNTKVESHVAGRVSVYLFGNLIALIGVEDLSFTLAGWNTTTTRSRINALLNEFAPGARVYQSKGRPFAITKWFAGEAGTTQWIVAKAREVQP